MGHSQRSLCKGESGREEGAWCKEISCAIFDVDRGILIQACWRNLASLEIGGNLSSVIEDLVLTLNILLRSWVNLDKSFHFFGFQCSYLQNGVIVVTFIIIIKFNVLYYFISHLWLPLASWPKDLYLKRVVVVSYRQDNVVYGLQWNRKFKYRDYAMCLFFSQSVVQTDMIVHDVNMDLGFCYLSVSFVSLDFYPQSPFMVSMKPLYLQPSHSHSKHQIRGKGNLFNNSTK